MSGMCWLLRRKNLEIVCSHSHAVNLVGLMIANFCETWLLHIVQWRINFIWTSNAWCRARYCATKIWQAIPDLKKKCPLQKSYGMDIFWWSFFLVPKDIFWINMKKNWFFVVETLNLLCFDLFFCFLQPFYHCFLIILEKLIRWVENGLKI